MRNCCKDINAINADDVVYKDIVVIGNGPSGILLSYILSGNWPYYNGQTHPDEMLTARLQYMPQELSILEQDLQILAQGLEGRSRNQVAVLMDNLNHPLDDQDLEKADKCLLDWRYNPDNALDHVVIGKDKPGGAWQNFNPELTTISISSWMELPQLPFDEWEFGCDNEEVSRPRKRTRRPKIGQVARYYENYVEHARLSKNFRNFSYVCSLNIVRNYEKYKGRLNIQIAPTDTLWEVRGCDLKNNRCFTYLCRNVVLAVGTSDKHKNLDIPGEYCHSEWVFHEMKSFEIAVSYLAENDQYSQGGTDPVLVIGSGLSAVDAVLIAERYGVSVLHVFNTHSMPNETRLSKDVYAEYHRVFQYMSSHQQSPNYTALAHHTVLEVKMSSCKDHLVKVMAPTGRKATYKVSLVAVMIGYEPDLDFLPEEYEGGRTLGIHKHQPIDSRTNPIAVLPWSYEVLEEPRGLYAMGPLVGDNVVRAIGGGAVAVASSLYRKARQS